MSGHPCFCRGWRAIPGGLLGVLIGSRVLASPPQIVPRPKQLTAISGALKIAPSTRLYTNERGSQGTADLVAALGARGLKARLFTRRRCYPFVLLLTGQHHEKLWKYLPGEGTSLSEGCRRPEGYSLFVTPGSVLLRGHDSAGLFYGVQTLLQWMGPSTAGSHVLRCVHIEDWPDMPIRAMHLCLFRYADRHPDIAYLKSWLGVIAPRAKLNTVIIQVDNLMQYRSHPEMSRPNALTHTEMKDLIAYARRRHLTVIPQLQCLSHQYSLFGFAHPDMLLSPGSETYNPLDRRVLPILKDLIRELRDVFGSRYIHLGFDEVDVQALRQNPQTQKTPPQDLYLKHLSGLCHIAHQLGLRPMIWPDMLLRWEKGEQDVPAPGFWSRLPGDLILCDWQYSARVNTSDLDKCVRSGREVWATGSAKYSASNLPNLALAARQRGIRALVGSTWNSFGPLTIPLELRSVSSLLAAGEYAWTVPRLPDTPLRIDAAKLTRTLLARIKGLATKQ